ncbi:hypothetical protein ACFXON_23700 [Bacillus subtilis]
MNVSAAARHAVIAVDGSVRLVYEIDPDGWEPNPDNPREWRFRAVGDRELSPELVDELHAAGELPYRIGSLCPTKAGARTGPNASGHTASAPRDSSNTQARFPWARLPPDEADDCTTGEQP